MKDLGDRLYEVVREYCSENDYYFDSWDMNVKRRMDMSIPDTSDHVDTGIVFTANFKEYIED